MLSSYKDVVLLVVCIIGVVVLGVIAQYAVHDATNPDSYFTVADIFVVAFCGMGIVFLLFVILALFIDWLTT